MRNDRPADRCPAAMKVSRASELVRTAILTGLLGIAAGAFTSSSGFALPITLEQTFDDPTFTDFDVFGWSVDLDGNNVRPTPPLFAPFVCPVPPTSSVIWILSLCKKC